MTTKGTKRETTSRSDDERFEDYFALMAGELAKMLADLIVALGGETDVIEVQRTASEHSSAGQQKIERAIRLTSKMYKARDTHRAMMNELHDQTVQPVIERVRA